MSPGVTLRQVAFAAQDLGTAEQLLLTHGAWRPVGQDVHSAVFGLTSHIYQRGSSFVEVLVPARPDSALQRFLDKRPGSVAEPYMLVLHEAASDGRAYDNVPDEWIVHRTQRPRYRSVHLRPQLVAPIMAAVAQPADVRRWPLTDELLDQDLPATGACFSEISIDVKDPELVSSHWSRLLGAPVDMDSEAFVIDGQNLRVRVSEASIPRIRAIGMNGDPSELSLGFLGDIDLYATQKDVTWNW